MNLIELSFLTSCFIIGFKIATSTGMILSKLGAKLEDIGRKYPTIMKPVYGCHYCMSSVYSVIFYSVFYHYSWHSFYELPVMIFAVCCLNGAFYNIAFNIWENEN